MLKTHQHQIVKYTTQQIILAFAMLAMQVHLDSFRCFEKFVALTGRRNGASCPFGCNQLQRQEARRQEQATGGLWGGVPDTGTARKKAVVCFALGWPVQCRRNLNLPEPCFFVL